MTRVDFYILDEATPPAMTVCKLCDKAVSAGQRVYVRAPEPAQLDELDKLLWSFRQGGFIAHDRHEAAEPGEPLPAVLLGDAEPPSNYQQVLINLAQEVPAWFSRFDRVLELVPGDAAARAASRGRYKFYKDRGYELNTYEQAADGGWRQRQAS